MVSFVISTLETTPQSLGGGENGIVTSTGILYSGNSSALTISGASADLINLGTIVSQSVYAINGTSLTGSTDISNFGTISGTSAGMNLGASDAAFVAIQNAGVIEGVDLANAIFISGSSLTSFVSNTGQILATLANALDFQFGGATTVMNAGIISGNILLGVGADTIRNSGSLLGDVFMGGGNDTFSGSGTLDGTLYGGSGNDRLIGSAFDDYFEGGDDFDFLSGSGGADSLFGGSGNDSVSGGMGDDALEGGFGFDRIVGDGGDDVLSGNADSDTLFGGSGDDELFGGASQDNLFGGLGRDTFVYTGVSDSPAAGPIDVIRDFEIGVDKIDFDNLSSGDLTFVGGGAFVGGSVGSVRITVAATGTSTVFVDNNGDGVADLRISIRQVSGLTADDFLL